MAIRILSSENISGEVLIASGKYLSWGTAGATSIEGSTVSNKIQFRTGSADRMIINNTGVGIGTDSPSSDISGSVTMLEINDATNNNLASLALKAGTQGSKWEIAAQSSNALGFFDDGTERMRIDSSGNVGIGTTSPTSYYSGADNLVIKQDSGEGGMSIVTANDTTGAIYFADGTSGNEQYRGGIGYTHSTDKLFLVSGGQTKVWMNDSGDVGIGTDSPGTKLEIYGNTSSGGYGVYPALTIKNDNASGYSAVHFNQSTSQKARIEVSNSTGALGLYTTSGTNGILIDSSGNVNVDSGRIRIAGGGSDSGTQLNLWSDTNGYCFIAGYQTIFNQGNNNSRSEVMRITSAGLGIGTASSSSTITY